MQELTLGKPVQYPAKYDSGLLQSIPRALGRKNILANQNKLPFTGVDFWNAYELSWLNTKRKPNIAILECIVAVTSPNLIESKSFKLYLNSFNQTVFDSEMQLVDIISKDLSQCAGIEVQVNLVPAYHFDQQKIFNYPGKLLDDLDIEFHQTQKILTERLVCSNDDANETLVSHLLKSNCLITNQPDWGSIIITYQGKKIDHSGLLQYLVSFREHNEFHEQCVERIFIDISTQCKPEMLSVYARYTRRGGIDINPFRSNFEAPYPNIRLARQ